MILNDPEQMFKHITTDETNLASAQPSGCQAGSSCQDKNKSNQPFPNTNETLGLRPAIRLPSWIFLPRKDQIKQTIPKHRWNTWPPPSHQVAKLDLPAKKWTSQTNHSQTQMKHLASAQLSKTMSLYSRFNQYPISSWRRRFSNPFSTRWDLNVVGLWGHSLDIMHDSI